MRESDRQAINLPVRNFMFTLDQIEAMTCIPVSTLTRDHLHFDGRSTGFKPTYKMMARDINKGIPDARPDWRIVDKEFVRWMKLKGFRVVERGYARD